LFGHRSDQENLLPTFVRRLEQAAKYASSSPTTPTAHLALTTEQRNRVKIFIILKYYEWNGMNSKNRQNQGSSRMESGQRTCNNISNVGEFNLINL